MTSTFVPDSDHVARHCSSVKWEKDKASMDAFLLRPGETYLSVDWLERTGESILVEQLHVVVKALEKRNRSVKAVHRLARLNVGIAKESVASHVRISLEFQSREKSKSDTYSRICGIPPDPRTNEKIALQLSVLTLGELYAPPLP